MSFTREDLKTYEAQPQTVVPDAKPAPAAAKAAEPAAAPSAPAAPSEPAASGDGTLDATGDSSTPIVEPANEAELEEEVVVAAEGETPPAAPAKPAKGSAQERIQELVDERDGYKDFGKFATAEVQRLRAEVETLRTGKPATPAGAAPKPPAALGPKPQLSDPAINYDPDLLAKKEEEWFQRAIAEGVRNELQRNSGQQTAVQIAETFTTRVEEFKVTHKDWELKTKNPALPKLAPASQLVLAKSELGPDILYHLANDLGLAQRVAKLPPEEQVMRLGEIKAELALAAKSKVPAGGKAPATPAPGAKPGAKKSVSQAPPPPSPTPAGGRASDIQETDPSLDMDEFARKHREGKQAARENARKARGLR